jgi:hypothetical protein
VCLRTDGGNLDARVNRQKPPVITFATSHRKDVPNAAIRKRLKASNPVKRSVGQKMK